MSEQVVQALPTVRALDLRKWYGRLEALKGVSFDVGAGEALGLLGPNGAGKSTTISLLTGLSSANSGSISLFGTLPSDLSARKRLGYLPESPIFPEHHSPASLLYFHARMLGIQPADQPGAVFALLEETGVANAAKKPIPTLSKGMLQRLGLAVALLGDPDLLILDEPTSNLDPVGRRQLCDLVRRQCERGRTVIFASHVLAEIETTCDRVVILNHGQVVLASSLAALRGSEGRSLEKAFFEALQIDQTTEGEPS